MQQRIAGVAFLVGIMLMACFASAQINLGTAFTYQGQVNQGATPLTGNVDVQFKLYDVPTGGVALGTSAALAVPVSGGLFSTTVDFGSLFDGRATWLELAVRFPAGSGSYVTLLPRQATTAAPYALGLRLPLTQTVSVSSDNALRIHNTAAGGRGLLGLASGAGGKGVYGSATGASAVGVYADCGSGAIAAVEGYHSTAQTDGKLGAPNAGVVGASGPGPTYGVYGVNSNANNGAAIRAEHTVSGNRADLGHPSRGVFGIGEAGTSVGVEGSHTASGNYGSLGTSVHGVYGAASSVSSIGVGGTCNGNSGTLGEQFFGVHGFTPHPDHTAVIGESGASSGSGAGVRGNAMSPAGYGVVGSSLHPTGSGVYGINPNQRTEAWLGGGEAISGQKKDAGGNVISAVQLASVSSAGFFNGLGNAGGVVIRSANSIGAHITSTSDQFDALSVYNQSGGYAATFHGNVVMFNGLHVNGSFVASGGKLFQIDHPLDPSNRNLSHSCIESPEYKNLYDGTVITDEAGSSIVQMPSYFEALNQDFRYQLTVIGSFSRAMIESEIKDNKFVIRTEQPNVKVCWLVTGNRHDDWARDHPLQVEQDKPLKDRGRRLYQPHAPEAPTGRPRPPESPQTAIPVGNSLGQWKGSK